jgi:hypothetical protein
VLAAAAFASSATYAQSPSGGAGVGVKVEASVKAGKVVKLSLPEMVAQAVTFEEQIKADVRHVMHLQTKARQAKDVIKLNCINDKLVQLKAQVNIFDAAHGSLKAGLEAGDAGGGAGAAAGASAAAAAGDEKQATYSEVTATAGAVKTLRAEADVCVGEPELFKQESSSEVKRPDIVDDPGTIDPLGDGPFEAPAYASPFC